MVTVWHDLMPIKAAERLRHATRALVSAVFVEHPVPDQILSGRYLLLSTLVQCHVRIGLERNTIAAVPMARSKTRPSAFGRGGTAIAFAILAACGGTQPTSTTSAVVSNPASADAFAQEVLAEAPLPPGARPTAAFHSDFLKQPFQTTGIGGLTDIHQIYSVEEVPAAVVSYITANLPHGARLDGTGTLGSPHGSARGVMLSVPTTGVNENFAELVYEVVPYGDRSSEFRIDAQVVWVANRSADELAPVDATVEVTGFSRISLMNPPSGPVTVKLSPAQVDSLRAVANTLPLAPTPGCMEDALLYKIVFRSGPPNQEFELDGYECNATVFVTSNGKAMTPLSDAGCSLFTAVVGLLPKGQAEGTRNAVAVRCH